MDRQLYNEYFIHIQKGQFDCPFAEEAIALGDSFRQGSDPDGWDIDSMLEYYFRGEFAARKRFLQTDDNAHEQLWERAKASLDSAKGLCRFKPADKTVWVDMGCLFEGFLNCGETILGEIGDPGDGAFRLTFRPNDKSEKQFFICIPALDICTLTSEFSVIAKPYSCQEFAFDSSSFMFDSIDRNTFYLNGKPVLRCGICNFELSAALF